MEFSNKLSRSLETVGETDYLVVILNLVFCIISSFILMYVYRNKANSLSSKIQISFIRRFILQLRLIVCQCWNNDKSKLRNFKSIEKINSCIVNSQPHKLIWSISLFLLSDGENFSCGFELYTKCKYRSVDMGKPIAL